MAAEYTFSGELKFEEYLECHKILASRRRIALRTVLTLSGLGMILSTLLSASQKEDKIILIYGVLFILYALVISPLQFRWRVRRLWSQYPASRKPFQVTLKPDGLQTIDDKDQPIHRDWSNFIYYRESPNCFLLYLSPLSPLILPKRLTPKQDLPAIKELLDERLGKNK